jgi:hypothetical protein
MKSPSFFKPLDFAAIGIALTITLVSAVSLYAHRGAQTRISIAGDEATWTFPQDAAELVTVAGPLGDTVVELRDGTARVRSSPCTNQTCVAAGAIQAHGQWIACLPNKVLIAIGTSGAEKERVLTQDEPGGDIDGAVW